MKASRSRPLRRDQLGTVQERLLVLLAVAVFPLCILGGLLAWQNYQILAALPLRRVELIHGAASARYQAIIDDARRLLEAVAESPGLSDIPASRCDETLEDAYRPQRAAFEGLALVDSQGRIKCGSTDAIRARKGRALTDGASPRGFAQSTASAVSLLPPGSPGASSILALATHLSGGAEPGDGGDTLVGALRNDWMTEPRQVNTPNRGSVWLLGGGGASLPLGAVDPNAFPNAANASEVLRLRAPVILTGANGVSYAYRSSQIVNGLDLLVGIEAGPDIAAAQRKFGVRLAELGAFLLAALIAVTVGANLTVVEPLRRLSASVQRWRAGGAFDLAPPARAPFEIRELSLSFGRAVESLAQRERQLRNASTQQDLLMQEIHHRVKNNLQIIASLLNLQASRIRLPEAKAEFQSARDRIRALATLHRHLYAHNELHTINTRSFLNELCSQLLAAIGDRPGAGATGRTEERIALEIDASDLQISSDQAVPIALIVTEAVSNAAKYAFPDGRTGHIWVKLSTESGPEGERARLVIRDDGIGIPAGRAETESGVRDGIGIQLIRGFARQLGAVLTVTEDGGTCYDIDIPLRRERPAETEATPAEAMSED